MDSAKRLKQMKTLIINVILVQFLIKNVLKYLTNKKNNATKNV